MVFALVLLGSTTSVASGAGAVEGSSRLLWQARYDVRLEFGGQAVTSPDGSRVYTAGTTCDCGIDGDFRVLVVAYDAVTGQRAWVSTDDPIPGWRHTLYGFAISPDGSTLFATGAASIYAHDVDMFTVALRADTGERLWAARYSGPGEIHIARDVAVSPDGETVYVTGRSRGKDGASDYATIAYAAATGKRVWVRRYDGMSPSDSAEAVVANGDAVFVTGTNLRDGADLVTVAYAADTGDKLWAEGYDGPAHGADGAGAIALSPDGSTLFASGTQTADDLTRDLLVVAYDAATGDRRWVGSHDGPKKDDDERASSLAVDPTGTTVFAGGSSGVPDDAADYLTVAFISADGQELWSSTYDGTGRDDEIRMRGVRSSPDGATVYVTGQSKGGPETGRDIGTVAYDAATGAELWVERYTGKKKQGSDGPVSLALSPDGTALYLGGVTHWSSDAKDDLLTLAYITGDPRPKS